MINTFWLADVMATLCSHHRYDIFRVQTERSAYILGREKVAEGEMGSDEFMRERGQSDSSYYHGADGERLSLRRICFRFNE